MKPITELLAAPLLAVLACCATGLHSSVQAQTFNYTEFQTVDINGLFPATGSNNIDVFNVAGTASNLVAPYDTTCYVRAASTTASGNFPRRVQLYVQFDLATLSSDNVAKATLDFTAYSLNDLTDPLNNPDLFVSQLTNDWSPSGDGGTLNPTFNPALVSNSTVNGGRVTSGNGTDLYTGGGFSPGTYRNPRPYSIDVTNIVKNWQGGAANNGFHLKLGDSVSFNQGIGINPSTLVLNIIQGDYPVPTLSTASSTATAPYTVNVNFSADVTGLDATDFTVDNGTASSVTGSGASYSVTITPNVPGNVQVTLPADRVNATVGGLGNLASSTLVTTYDPPLPPSVTLSTSAGVYDVFTVNVVFSEVVTGLDLSDFNVTNGTASSLAGTGASYTVVITTTTPGNVEVTLPADSVTDLDDSLGNLVSNNLSVVYDPANSALTSFPNGNLNSAVTAIPATGSGNFAFSLNPTTNTVLYNGTDTGVRGNQWILSSLTRGLIYNANRGAGGTGDGAFVEAVTPPDLIQNPRAVFYFSDDNKQTTGSIDFGMDVFFDDNTPANPLTFMVEIYGWNDGQVAPLLSAGGPTANDPTYNVTTLGGATTILNTQIAATSVADATWQTIALGSVNVGSGYDNYVWRIGVMGATTGDVFAFDNVTATAGTAAPEIKVTQIDRAANGDVTILFTTSSGNVDVYRSTDLVDFGENPIDTNVAPGTYIDNTAAALPKAFYVLVPAGAPAP